MTGLVAEAIGAESATICVLEDDAWVPRHGWKVPAEVVGVPIPREQVPYANLAIETQEVVGVDDCETDPRVDLELQRSWGVRSVAMAPLLVRDRTAAGIFVNYHSDRHAFTRAELDFMRQAAGIVTGTVKAAHLYASEHEVAGLLRSALLAVPRTIPGVEFDTRYHSASESARIGGDFYDVFELDHGLLGLTVGDVSGKGLPAATVTSLVKHTLRGHASEKGKGPADVVRAANTALLRAEEFSGFCTIFFAILDRRDGRLVYCNAGHPPMALLRSDGSVGVLENNGPLVGAFEALDFGSGETWMEAGELLFLYTDGLIEARASGVQFGEERLFELLGGPVAREPAGLLDLVERELLGFAGDGLQDDLAMLALTRTHAPVPGQGKFKLF